jgi:hypothetical protein
MSRAVSQHEFSSWGISTQLRVNYAELRAQPAKGPGFYRDLGQKVIWITGSHDGFDLCKKN